MPCLHASTELFRSAKRKLLRLIRKKVPGTSHRHLSYTISDYVTCLAPYLWHLIYGTLFMAPYLRHAFMIE